MDRPADTGPLEGRHSAAEVSGAAESHPLPGAAVAPLQGGRVGERSDSYPATVAVLSENWRVIACRNGIQWILQRRSGPNRWDGRSYARDRASLLILIRRHAGPVDPAGIALVEALPEWIEESR